MVESVLDMAKTKITLTEWLRTSVLRLTRVHFFLIGAMCLQILFYDAWKLLAPEAVLQRWVVTLSLLIVVTIVWFLSHTQNSAAGTYRRLIFILVLADIIAAAIEVYLQRGMASRSVMLFAVPIISSAVLLNPTAIFATATFCVVAYVTAAVTYFVVHFNEGYKIELYGEVGFYSGVFFILAGLLSVLVRFREK